jgi:hypothetical protein
MNDAIRAQDMILQASNVIWILYYVLSFFLDSYMQMVKIEFVRKIFLEPNSQIIVCAGTSGILLSSLYYLCAVDLIH